MSGEEKLQNCKFRSEKELIKVVKRCSCRGGNYEKRGYYCNRRQLFEVNPNICQTCELFESR
jgi:hypothetical protein